MQNAFLKDYIVALADDELVLGHRDSEWTGYAPILEEDIAFSNIAQDELGHSLALYTLAERLGASTPDAMAFERPSDEFLCCRFVEYPRGDFAYTVVRQFLFDVGEEIRMRSLLESSYAPLREVSGKILAEEAYHRMHSEALVERLGDATQESRRRMRVAVDEAFPQALGIFEPFGGEEVLVRDGVIRGSDELRDQWLAAVVPPLEGAGLTVPVVRQNGHFTANADPDIGGRTKRHTQHLKNLVADMQLVYGTAPGARW